MKNFLYGYLAFLLAGCASSKPKTAAELHQLVTVIGTYIGDGKQFPTYTLSLTNDRWAHYNGISRMDKLGTYKRLLTEEEYKALVNATKPYKIPYLSYENQQTKQGVSIQSDVAATPKKQISMTPEHKAKVADEVHQLAIKIIKAGEWISSFAMSSQAPKPDEIKYVTDEILLSLKNGASPDVILTNYKNYALKTKRNISKTANYWLMSFDQKTIQIDALIELLKKDNQVVAVSKNRILEERK